MPIMPDSWIRERATKTGMIEPFVENLTRDGVIACGFQNQRGVTLPKVETR